MKRLVVIGAGGYGQTVYDVALQLQKYDEISFLDDNSIDARVVGKCEDYLLYISEQNDIYPAFGNNEQRVGWLRKIESSNGKIPTIIHPTAYVSPKADIGKGTVILPKAIVNTNVRIKEGCIVNCGTIVDHGCILENGVHICLGAIVKADNRIPECMKIEAGTVVENRKYPVNGE